MEDVVEKIEDVIDSCEDDKKSDDKKDEKIDDQTKTVVEAAIEALYDKALLCESTEEADVYIHKAEELQNAIDDIPEEKPVVDDEYPADDVTGGEGEKLDQEEIKDLIGDDAEALALLTQDDNSVIIDA